MTAPALLSRVHCYALQCHNWPSSLQVAMAHAPADEAPIPDGYSVSDEFFVYKFSKEQAGLSGLAFDEGIFGVFGYVTEASSEPSALCGFAPHESCAYRSWLFPDHFVGFWPQCSSSLAAT